MKKTRYNISSVTGAAALLAGTSFLSRIIGIARDRIFAHLYGAGDVLDMYFASFRIPDTVYNLIILGAISAGLVPIFSEAYKKNPEKGWKIIHSVLFFFLVAIIPLSIILWVFMPQLMSLLVPGFSASQLEMSITMSRVLLLSPIILGVSGILGSVLQSTRQFVAYSLTPIVYNLGIIFGALFFSPVFGPIGLAYGVILGTLLHLFVQIPSLRTLGLPGFSYRFVQFSKEIRELLGLMIPRIAALGTNQFLFFAITFVASTLGTGQITVFQFANNLQYFPVGIIGISYAIAAFPSLTEKYVEKDIQGMKDELLSSCKQVLFLIIPATIILIILRAQIIRIIYGTGAFDWQDTIATANTLAWFSISLFAQAIIPLLTRVFYAMKDTITPFVGAFIGITITIGTMSKFAAMFGTPGLAAAFSLGMIVQFIFLMIMTRKVLGSLSESSCISFLLKTTFAGLMMAILIQVAKPEVAMRVNMQSFFGVAMQFLISSGVGFLGYLIITSQIGVKESSQLWKKLLRR